MKQLFDELWSVLEHWAYFYFIRRFFMFIIFFCFSRRYMGNIKAIFNLKGIKLPESLKLKI